MPLKLISINCRGLKNKNIKRWQIFNICRKYDISCLQETHVTHALIPKWRKEWQGEIKYIEGTNRSKGQVILINKDFKYSNLEEIHTSERIQGINLTTEEGSFPIFNIYGPNDSKERETFFKNLSQAVQCIEDPNELIICGDFNVVLDNKLDIISGNEHKLKDVKLFQRFLNSHELCDSWRALNENVQEATWSRTSPYIARRLDFIILNKDLISKVAEIKHIAIPHTDHKGVAIELKKSTFKRGPNMWKCNTSLIKDPDYLKGVVEKIIIFLETYKNMEPQMKFELLKVEIKNFSISYSTQKSKMNKDRQGDLEANIENITKELIKDPKSEDLNTKLLKAKQELELIHIHKAKGAQTRSRTQWVEEGEKNTKFFLGLEKAKGNANTIEKLTTNEQTHTNPLNILSEIKSFYQNLYTKDNTITNTESKLDDFLKNTKHPTLNPEDKKDCDENMTLKEVSLALSHLNNDSAPGSDGLPVPLYKVLWKYIKQPLFDSLQAAIRTGSLSITQRRGIITLFHKGKDLDRNNLGNWRPITLTNTDYKIFSKLLALRIQKVIATIVHSSQKGYVKGRSISDTIRIIDDFINISNKTKTPGLLVSIDFQKAFDSIEKPAIISTLKKFGFGDTFVSYISVLLKNTLGCVRNGGWHSSWFETQRGVKQGCPLSPYLFVLVAELMSIKIRSNPQLKKSNTQPFGNRELADIVNILLYADDTTLLLKDESALKIAFEIIEELGKFTGLKLNRKKSLILPVGDYKPQNNNQIEVTWVKKGECIKILGIYFSSNIEASQIEKNWLPKIENMKNTIKRWHNRHISLYGKVIIAKTFLLSQWTYVIQSLTPPEEILNKIDSIIFNFLWENQVSGKKVIEKIKRNTLCLDASDGGLQMISIKDQSQVFQLKWLKKALSPEIDDKPIKDIANYYLSSLGGAAYLTHGTIDKSKQHMIDIIPSKFWKTTIYTLQKIKNQMEESNEEKSQAEILSQPIFFNSNIKYKQKTLYIERWIKKGIKYILDIYSEGRPHTINTLAQKVGNNKCMEMMNYNAVINAIPRAWKTMLTNISVESVNKAKEIISSQFGGISQLLYLSNKYIRREIVRNKNEKITSVDKWLAEYSEDIRQYFIIPYNATKESKLRLLQYKILHRIFPTNSLLSKMKIKESNTCEYCEKVDDIEHYFFHCTILKGYWKLVTARAYINTKKEVKLDPKNVIFGITKEQFPSLTLKQVNMINYYILIGKSSITKLKNGYSHNLGHIFDSECRLRQV